MKLTKLVCASLMAMALAACSDTSAPSATAPASSGVPAKQQVSIEAITKDAKGFTAGSMMASRQLYVFFDSQCPHCGELWNQTRAYDGPLKTTWIPVTFMSKASVAQGAALLQAANPVEAMDAHEALLLARQGGMSASADVPKEIRDILAKNTDVLKSFGALSVPFVVGVNEKTGDIVTFTGSVPKEQFATRFGW